MLGFQADATFNATLMRELRAQVAQSINELDQSIISSLLPSSSPASVTSFDWKNTIPADRNADSSVSSAANNSKIEDPSSRKQSQNVIEALVRIRDEIIGHSLRWHLFIEADLIPRLQTILLTESSETKEEFQVLRIQLQVSVLKVLHALLLNGACNFSKDFITDTLISLLSRDIDGAKPLLSDDFFDSLRHKEITLLWKWRFAVLLAASLQSYPACTDVSRLLATFKLFLTSKKLDVFPSASESFSSIITKKESDLIELFLAHYCGAFPSFIAVLKTQGIVEWISSLFSDNDVFLTLSFEKLKLIDSIIAERYSELLAPHLNSLLVAASKRLNVILHGCSATQREPWIPYILSRVVPSVLQILKGSNSHADDMPCNCTADSPCLRPKANRQQIKDALFLLKKIVFLITEGQGIIMALVMSHLELFPEPALNCILALVEVCGTENNIFVSEEQKLVLVKQLFDFIEKKANYEYIFFLALKVLRTLSRNVREMRGVRFEEINTMAFTSLLVDKLKLKDDSIVAIILNIIANLSLEFCGLRLDFLKANLLGMLSFLLNQYSQSQSNDREEKLERVLQVIMNISHRAPFELRKRIMRSMDKCRSLLVTMKSNASKAILQNFTCAESFEEIDWLLNELGEEKLFSLLSDPQYLPVLSNIAATASHIIKRRLSDSPSISHMILKVLKSRLSQCDWTQTKHGPDSARNDDDLGLLRVALLAAAQLKGCVESEQLEHAIQQLAQFDPSSEIRTLALESIECIKPRQPNSRAEDHVVPLPLP